MNPLSLFIATLTKRFDKRRLAYAVRNFKDYLALLKLSDGSYRIRDRVAYYCQFASPHLTKDILEKKISATEDPKWQSFGFSTPEQYEFWSWRACAIMCVKMVLDTISDTNGNTEVRYLIEKGVQLGGYVAFDEQGSLVDKGWYYLPLINLSKEYGVGGEIFPYLSFPTICAQILNKHFFVASVDPKIIRGDQDRPKSGKGGHLVLVHGFEWMSGRCVGFYIHNPSGKKDETRENVFVPMELFAEAFGRRGFTLWKEE